MLSNFGTEFWIKFGQNLRRLELLDCVPEPGRICFILLNCPELVSFSIKGTWMQIRHRRVLHRKIRIRSIRNLSKHLPLASPLTDHYWGSSTGGAPRGEVIDYLAPPDGIDFERVRESLRNVRHLHLMLPLTHRTFDSFLGLMPNTTHLSIIMDSELLCLVPRLLQTGQRYAKLYLKFPVLEIQVVQLVGNYKSSLRELLLRSRYLTSTTYEAIGKSVVTVHLYYCYSCKLFPSQGVFIVRHRFNF